MRLSLAFSHGRPSTEDEEVETFGPRLQFSAETPVATLGPVFLDQPLPQANE